MFTPQLKQASIQPVARKSIASSHKHESALFVHGKVDGEEFIDRQVLGNASSLAIHLAERKWGVMEAFINMAKEFC